MKPKTWGEMTPEEKGALLLAAHEGKVIEYQSPNLPVGCWEPIYTPSWGAKVAYRIKPEPKRETVTLRGRNAGGGWSFAQNFNTPLLTHRITFDLIDGEPDCDSIKMERLS